MENYKNLSRNSEVKAYEIEVDSIQVQFKDGAVYLYNFKKPGIIKTKKMQELAVSGRGLNSFINTDIKEKYFKKIK